MSNPKVIDLSHHNPEPVWSEVKRGGTLGLIHKATEGTSFLDKTLYRRIAAARKAGLVTSTYHFLRPGSVEAQMDWYLEKVDPLPGERLCLDHEDPGVTLPMLEEAVTYLHERRPDCQLTIYSGHLIKAQLGSGKSPTLATLTSLWIAHYTTKPAPTWPKGTWPVWSLWQYTDGAEVSGISKPVDGNKWNGSDEALLTWFGSAAAPEPQPEPQPEPEPVKIDIRVPPGVPVTITVNGETI